MKQIIVFVSILLLLSCNRNQKLIYIKLKNQSGLKEGDPVAINAFRVGTVEKFILSKNYDVLAITNLDNSIDLSTDSKFRLKSIDLFGSKSIDIIPGISKFQIKAGDTVQIEISDALTMPDSLSLGVKKIVTDIVNKVTEDSLTKEIKRLNNNVEELKEKLKHN
jgi:ABC-type transporter Mla subunit MlaD